MRCCSAEKGSGRPSAKARTSPSSTVPSGRCVAAAAISGKRWVIELLAARPEPRLSAAPDELRADAIPFPFDQPVARIAERVAADLRAATRGRTGRAATGRRRRVRRARRTSNHSADGVQSPMSRAAIVVGSLPAASRQRADDERLRDADAELAGQQLVEEEALGRAAGRATSAMTRSRCAAGSAFCSGSSRSSTHAASGRSASGGPGGHGVERERDELGEIAGGGVALVEQPLRQSRRLLRPLPQPRRRHDALQPPAGEKEDRPRGVGRRRVAEIGRQRRDLGVGGRGLIDRLVERAEPPHVLTEGLRPSVSPTRALARRFVVRLALTTP